jgi:hypothetical protein
VFRSYVARDVLVVVKVDRADEVEVQWKIHDQAALAPGEIYSSAN